MIHGHRPLASNTSQLLMLCFAGVPKGAMLTHGNLVADSAGMVRVTQVSPGLVRTAYGIEESSPGESFPCHSTRPPWHNSGMVYHLSLCSIPYWGLVGWASRNSKVCK